MPGPVTRRLGIYILTQVGTVLNLLAAKTCITGTQLPGGNMLLVRYICLIGGHTSPYVMEINENQLS